MNETSGSSPTNDVAVRNIVASTSLQKFKKLRLLLLSISLVLGVMFTLSESTQPTCAQGSGGCSASGSIPLLASTGTTCATALQIGQQKDITVRVHNTSSRSPGGTPVTASVHGTITY